MSPFSRRDMLRAGGAGSLMAAGFAVGMPLAMPHPAQAKAAPKGAQAPGYFRFKLGTFEITIISDGNLYLPISLLAGNVPEAELKAFLKSYFLPSKQHMAHLNLALINTGERLILVDAGSGLNFQDWAGKAATNLEAAGYKREDVDAILITHGHPDHVWGIIDSFEEAPRFPSAEYYINGVEWDFWTNEANAVKLPEERRSFHSGARKSLLPVSARTKRIKAGDSPFPGIHLIDSPGHTPGHLSVLAESGGEKLLITADAMTHAYISLVHPEWRPVNDMDGERAVQSRKQLADMAAGERLAVVIYHAPFPGVGHIAREGTAYRWIPAVWEWDI